MGRAEVSWKKKNEDGEKREVYAKHIGNRWVFFAREKRYDEWSELTKPTLDDWTELLDGVRRRINRRLLRPEEEERVLNLIRLQYPDADL
jgi:hypothetical protein